MAHLPVPPAKGAPAWLDRQGKLGLMILKHYFNSSDARLLEHLSTNWAAQLFCGISLPKGVLIQDQTLVSRVRSELGRVSTLWQALQQSCLNSWLKELVAPHFRLADATCYESYIRYPTDVKLLWESVEWVYEKGIYSLCAQLSIARPRSRYLEQKRKYIHYSKLKKKTQAKTWRRKKSLLYLLTKGLSQLQIILNQYARGLALSPAFFKRIKTIRKVLLQQQYLLKTPKKKQATMPGRIVSLAKPYIHPIPRGKENKATEFGFKAHILQVGGINCIEHLSNRAFHEGNRLKKSVLIYQSILGTCRQFGADRIYASNKNRKWITEKKIATCFPRKGPQKKLNTQQKAMRQLLAKERASRLEGSFGNEKNHYALRKVKARTYPNEILWIFFGILTANAVKIREQRRKKTSP